MNSDSNAFLGTQPMGRLMRKFALPCVVSLLFGALYNIVDQIFIANADYLGSYGNASNSESFRSPSSRWRWPRCSATAAVPSSA